MGAGPGQNSCSDDVSITVLGIYDLDYLPNDPPDYGPDDELWIYYDVVNASCQSVEVTVALQGSVSETAIENLDPTDVAACLEGCTVAGNGGTLQGYVKWDLEDHPSAAQEYVDGQHQRQLAVGFR